MKTGSWEPPMLSGLSDRNPRLGRLVSLARSMSDAEGSESAGTGRHGRASSNCGAADQSPRCSSLGGLANVWLGM